jgi:hypothetical protein
METPQNQTPVAKKRVIKIKKSAVKPTEPTVEPATVIDPVTQTVPVTETVTTEPTTEPVTETTDKEQVSIIPSSRIKNYISKEKLNKEIDTLIESIKSSTDNIDLSKVLSVEYQAKVGAAIKEKEKKNEEIKLNSVVVDVLAKHKYKFSNNSFKVLSVFLDMMIEEITLHVMNELVQNKKSIINIKYLFTNENTSGRLFDVYSRLSTYQAEKMAQSAVPTEPVETVEPTESAETTEPTEPAQADETAESVKSINFEFYVRKICNKLRASSEEFSKIKVSDKYQKFCSNLILDLLNRVIPLTKIVLDVMTTKTITELVFETILKTQLFDNQHMDELLTELHRRLQN